jgi:hypothetical protein
MGTDVEASDGQVPPPLLIFSPHTISKIISRDLYFKP